VAGLIVLIEKHQIIM
jgi:hypothetical protein